jgi:ArsR family metal-binding transcriptional regulator
MMCGFGVRDKDRPEFKMSDSASDKVIEILKLLPKSNCRECGQATCMVFASLMANGIKGSEDCRPLDECNRIKLSEYMSLFRFD